MCGIAGFINADTIDPSDFHSIVNRMLTAIRYRGPDEIGCRVDNGGALGTVRLTILDARSGQQPMASPDNRYWLCFNGEIFNYLELRKTLEKLGNHFATRSDTEVLLAALIQWGEDALSRLDGQFGFAFYDRRNRSVLIARDRFGERPLFYTQVGRSLVFASEIKALFQHPAVSRELSPTAVSSVFKLWSNLPGRTCFRDIDALPAGHYLKFQNGQADVARYYTLPAGIPERDIEPQDAADELRRRLKDSVRLRLRSDVPVGVYLSGGLDSAIVTALMRELSTAELHSYSIAFAEKEYDESDHQRTAVERYRTKHHEIRIGSADIFRVFPDVVRHAETPLFRSAPAPMYLLAKAVSADGLKVVMSGEGADEAFLGYDIFKESRFRADYDLFPSDDARRRAAEQLYPYMSPFDGMGRESLARALSAYTAGAVSDPLFSHRMRFALGHFADRLLTESDKDAETTLGRILCEQYPGFSDLPLMTRAQVLEYLTLLEGYLLSSQGDRMTTAHGVEGRCPFLDHAIVEFAFSLKERLKLRDGIEKFILKDAFQDLLPSTITTRAKQPYRAPDCRAFLARSGDDWLGHILEPSNVARCGLFRGDVVTKFIGRLKTITPEQISPREDQAFMLLISTLLLWEQFVENFRPAGQTDFSRFSVFEDCRA